MGSPTSCILLVEDELLFQLLTVEQLANLGFAIETADSATEAMRKLRQVDAEFAAAIIDMGLPDRNGDLLVIEVRTIFPTLPIVIASGCADDDLRVRFKADNHIAFLEKPYMAEQLRTVLGSLGVRCTS
jgi:CheY-like chemotaxis protein